MELQRQGGLELAAERASGRQYRVYKNDQLEAVYAHFNRDPAGAGYELSYTGLVPGVDGYFYCDENRLEDAKRELKIYAEHTFGAPREVFARSII